MVVAVVVVVVIVAVVLVLHGIAGSGGICGKEVSK